MRSVLVVVLHPFCDLRTGLIKRGKQRFIEAFVPETAVGTFDESVLCWLARRNVVPINLGLLAPFEHR